MSGNISPDITSVGVKISYTERTRARKKSLPELDLEPQKKEGPGSSNVEVIAVVTGQDNPAPSTQIVKKKRGRPPKKRVGPVDIDVLPVIVKAEDASFSEETAGTDVTDSVEIQEDPPASNELVTTTTIDLTETEEIPTENTTLMDTDEPSPAFSPISSPKRKPDATPTISVPVSSSIRKVDLPLSIPMTLMDYVLSSGKTVLISSPIREHVSSPVMTSTPISTPLEDTVSSAALTAITSSPFKEIVSLPVITTPILTPMKDTVSSPSVTMAEPIVSPMNEAVSSPTAPAPISSSINETMIGTISSPMKETMTTPISNPTKETVSSPAMSAPISIQVNEIMMGTTSSPMKETMTTPISSPMMEAMTTPISNPMKEAMTTPISSPMMEAMTTPISSPMKEAMTPISSPMKEAMTPISSPMKEAMTPISSPMKEAMTIPISSPMKEAMTTPISSPMRETVSSSAMTTPVSSPFKENISSPSITMTTPISSPIPIRQNIFSPDMVDFLGTASRTRETARGHDPSRNIIPGFDFVTESDPAEMQTESVAQVVSNLFAKPKGKGKGEKKTPVQVSKPVGEVKDESDDSSTVRRSSRIRTLETRRGGRRRREVVFPPSSSSPYENMSISISSTQDDDSNSNGSNGSTVPSSPMSSCSSLSSFSLSHPSTPGSPPRDTYESIMGGSSAMKLKSRWRNSLDAESLFKSAAQPSESGLPVDMTSLSLSDTPLQPEPVFAPNFVPLPLPVPPVNFNLIRRPGYITYDRTDTELEEKLKKFQGIDESIYRTARRIIKENKNIDCDCGEEGMEVGCGEDCMNRMLFVECGAKCASGNRCRNKRFTRREYCGLEVFKTDKKGYGLRTSEPLPRDGFVIEYVGEVLSPREFCKRTKEYAKGNQEHFYFMLLKADNIIDATLRGNCSRFINHSCEPNCVTQKWTVNGEIRIGFFALRDLAAGEEITFNYQFERYGKEAQPCFCLAPKCRGWIGGDKQKPEEPEEQDEDEEEEEDEDEDEDEVEEEEADVEAKVVTKVKVKRIQRRRRKDAVHEDVLFETELYKLETTGLRNRMQTLSLTRLMVRAENWDDRERILKILISGDVSCLRLFLDYRGLRLIWGWMLSLPLPSVKLTADSASMRSERFHLLVLKTLEILPIPNKTLLQDSKVLAVVEKWSLAPPNSALVTKGVKKEATEPVPRFPETHMVTTNTGSPSVISINDEPQSAGAGMDSPMDVTVTVKEEDVKMDSTVSVVPAAEPSAPAEEVEIIVGDLLWEFVDVSKDLLASWSGLQEVFRIPKRERVEQLKEHEREADQAEPYSASELDRGRISAYDRDGRFKHRNKIERRITSSFPEQNRDFYRHVPNIVNSLPAPSLPNMSKEQRRILFAAKVAREEEEEKNRRKQDEMVSLHQERCAILGLDVTTVPIVDSSCSYYLDPTTVNWKGIDLQDPLLPPEVLLIVQFSQNPPEQIHELYEAPQPFENELFPPWPAGLPPPPPFPPATLPRYWKMNVDEEGRCYYYDSRTRHTQWEPPSPDQSEGGSESDDSEDSEDGDSEGQGLSTGSGEGEVSTSQEVDDQSLAALKFHTWINERSEKRKKSGLVQERIISPRSEEERPFMNTKSIRAKKLEYLEQRLAEEAAFHNHNHNLEPESGLESLSAATAAISLEKSLETDEESSQPSPAAITPTKSHRRRREKPESPQLGPGPEIEADPLEDEGHSEVIPGLQEPGTPEEIGPESPSETSLLSLVTSPPLPVPPPVPVPRPNQRVGRASGSSRKGHRSKSGGERKSLSTAKVDGEKEKLHLQKKLKQTSMDCFRSQIANVIVQHLNPYRKPDCANGRIQSTEDFKHLARKMTHTITLKELKRCQDGKTLVVSESVKHKTKEYVRKYMAKFPGNYLRSPDAEEMTV